MTTWTEPFRVERKLPAAVLVALLVQAAVVLLWSGRAAARIDALESRAAASAGVGERLARLEAQGEAARASLARIEDRLEAAGSRQQAAGGWR